MRTERETAESLKSRLIAEAEETRKKTKRNAFTGIHKYLDLVRNKNTFACLVANAGSDTEEVISFPPITNRFVFRLFYVSYCLLSLSQALPSLNKIIIANSVSIYALFFFAVMAQRYLRQRPPSFWK